MFTAFWFVSRACQTAHFHLKLRNIRVSHLNTLWRFDRSLIRRRPHNYSRYYLIIALWCAVKHKHVPRVNENVPMNVQSVMKMVTCQLCLSWWLCRNRLQQCPGWSKYTILSVALKCTITLLLFFFVVGFLKGKGRKAYNLGNSRSEMEKAVIQTRFGKKGLELWIHSRSSPLPLPVTCFSGRASWTLMTTNIPESPSRATPRTQHTSSLEDTSIFCLETDKKHKRTRHVSVKSAAFASSPVPSVFSYPPARAIRCVVMRRNPTGKFSWLVVIFFFSFFFFKNILRSSGSVQITKVSGR